MRLDIKRIAHSRGITLKALAERCGKSPQYLSDISKGKFNPSIKTIEEIASALNMEVSELLTGNKGYMACPHCGKNIEVILTSDVDT